MLTRNRHYFSTSHPLNRDAEQTIREELEFILMHADDIDMFNNVGSEFDPRVMGSIEDPEYFDE